MSLASGHHPLTINTQLLVDYRLICFIWYHE
jgi:hypothetical protein